MADELPFPHHSFSGEPDQGPHALVSSDIASPVTDPCTIDSASIADSLRSAGVVEIMLIHGTFAGNDIVGLMRMLHRISPRLSSAMKTLGKQWFDQLADENGNYTSGYAECLSRMVNIEQRDDIAVTRVHWSGENHHLGRALGAVSLLDTMLARTWTGDQRLLLFAHSHGGNLLAIITLLLGSSQGAREKFFQAIHIPRHAVSADPVTHDSVSSQLDRVCASLMDDRRRSNLPQIDIATFGTPLRYGWNNGICKNLLHFVQHRPLIEGEPARAALPQSIGDIAHARGGDYVQQIGIGGTDFPHPFFAWDSWRSERQLRRIFEPTVRRRDLQKNLRRGHRVSLDGKTLLVDYGSTRERWNQKLFGHGVYTCRQWLPFHLREVVKEFYS